MPKFYSHKVFLFIIGFVALYHLNANANSYELKWFNQERKLLIKIDLQTNQVFQEIPNAENFEFIGTLGTKHPEITSLDCDIFNVQEFKLKNRPIISIKGTSLVYQFVRKGNTFELIRLDQSNFKGYNFFAYQFVRKDTLFSIGGYGFWNYNNKLTFFDEKNKGWELYKINNEGPLSVDYSVCGYDSKKDGIWTLNLINPENLISGKNEQNLYFYDFKTKNWDKKGEINKEILAKYHASFEKAIWIDNHFIFNLKEVCIAADPGTLQLTIFDQKNGRNWGNGSDIIQIKDSIYLYSAQQEINPNIKFQQVKTKASQFLSQFKPIDESFVKFPIYTSKIFLMFAIILASLGVSALLFLSFKKQNSIFNDIELAFLKMLQEKEEGISTEDLNQFLDIAKKNVDIQKNQRNQFIKNINTKFQAKQSTEDNLVDRKSSENDKRFVRYVVNGKYVGTLS